MSETDDEAILRLTGRFLLDQVTVVRFAFDLIDALIIVAVTQANVDPISNDRELQRRYAGYEDAPPDDLRRPITINAVAQSLDLPFETIRRRIVKLALFGVCRIDKQGVHVPAAVVDNPRHKGSLEACYHRLAALHRDLDALGEGEPANPEVRWTGAAPLRLTARVSTEYNLRFTRLLTDVAGDPVNAVIWVGVFCECRDETGRITPINLAALSRRLRLSHETVRRRTETLAAAGLLTKSARGVAVGPEVLKRPAVERLFVRSRQDLRRMMTVLADFGIVQVWRAERGASAAA